MGEVIEPAEAPVVSFSSPLNAALWACEKMACAGGYAQPRLEKIKGVGGNPWHEIQDAALTVSRAIADTDPPLAGLVLRLICDSPDAVSLSQWRDAVRGVAEQAASEPRLEVEAAPGAIMRGMANVAVLRVRHETLWPDAKVKPPVRNYAAAAGVTKGALAQPPWLNRRTMLELVAREYRDRALHQLGERLDRIGLIYANRSGARGEHTPRSD